MPKDSFDFTLDQIGIARRICEFKMQEQGMTDEQELVNFLLEDVPWLDNNREKAAALLGRLER